MIKRQKLKLVWVFCRTYIVFSIYIWGAYFIVHQQLGLVRYLVLQLWLFIWLTVGIAYHFRALNQELDESLEFMKRSMKPFVDIVKEIADVIDEQEKNKSVTKEEKS